MDTEMRETAKQVTLVTGRAVYLDGIPDAKDSELKAQTARGLTVMQVRKWDDAISHFQEAFNRSESLEQSAALLSLIGSCHFEQCRWQQALDSFSESARLAGQAGDKPGRAHALNYIGSVYSNKGELDHALKNHEEALAIAREAGYSHGEASTLSNIGLLYATQGKPDKALPMLVEARLIFLGIGAQSSAKNPTQTLKLLLQQTGRERFVNGCVEAGMTSEDAEELAEADLRRDRPMAD
jgi:tetratricopeptide (TPR) repeat protein